MYQTAEGIYTNVALHSEPPLIAFHAIYDSYAMRKFTGINFLTESVPDETTLCKFRHLLEEHGLNKLFFEAINRVMVETGHMLKGGTIVDATIINSENMLHLAAYGGLEILNMPFPIKHPVWYAGEGTGTEADPVFHKVRSAYILM